jgi:hypothetical protein
MCSGRKLHVLDAEKPTPNIQSDMVYTPSLVLRIAAVMPLANLHHLLSSLIFGSMPFGWLSVVLPLVFSVLYTLA